MEHKVYKIKNLINGKIYIGVTKNTLKYRFKQHSKAKSYVGNAIRKYGIDNFSIEGIYSYNNEYDSYNKESEIVTKEFIKLENNYNQKPGGIGGGDTSKYIDYDNPLTKQKISKASKNYWNTKLGYKKEFMVNCFKCETNFVIIEREKQFPKKEKYFCSKFCARSRPATKEANEKRKISNKKYNLNNNVKPTNNSKGTKYINKCGIIKRVKPENLKNYLDNGWILGKK